MTGAVAFGVAGYLCFVAFVCGLFWVLMRRAPEQPFTDPSTREDPLEAAYKLPAFDPRELA
jgi:nitrate reductase gamma subunit